MIDISFISNFFFRQEILDFLNMQIIPGIIDVWIFYHFFVALISYLLIKKTYKNAKNLTILGILSTEFVELILISRGIIYPETTLNMILDIVAGLVAIKVVDYFN